MSHHKHVLGLYHAWFMARRIFFIFFNILINISVSITYILTFIKALAQVQDRLCHVYIIRTLKQLVQLTLSCTTFSNRKNFSIVSQLDLSNNWPRDSTTESQVFREHQSASSSSFEPISIWRASIS